MSGARPSPRPLPRRQTLLLFSVVFLLIGVLLFAEGVRRYVDRGSPTALAAAECERLRHDHDAWERCLSHFGSRSRRDAAMDVLPGLLSATAVAAGALLLMLLTPRREEAERVPPGA